MPYKRTVYRKQEEQNPVTASGCTWAAHRPELTIGCMNECYLETL